MKTKIFVSSILIVFILALLPTSAFAGTGKYSQSKYSKSHIAYDTSDDHDNAHPSGKDRSVEKGRSFTQGKSKSDPDNNNKGPERNYGKSDKPRSIGGVDKYDQDGNNGCGNDDDFEDDNEGWCGKKPKKPATKTENKDCEPKIEKPKEEPKGSVISTPVVEKTPVVASSVKTLPQTGNTSSPVNSLIGNLALAVALILSGILFNLVIKYRESRVQ